jgi:hypothetical protein
VDCKDHTPTEAYRPVWIVMKQTTKIMWIEKSLMKAAYLALHELGEYLFRKVASQ